MTRPHTDGPRPPAALALLGAALGIAGAYVALIAGYIHDLKPLGNVPLLHFSITIVGLPLLAAIAGWLLAGAEPPAHRSARDGLVNATAGAGSTRRCRYISFGPGKTATFEPYSWSERLGE